MRHGIRLLVLLQLFVSTHATSISPTSKQIDGTTLSSIGSKLSAPRMSRRVSNATLTTVTQTATFSNLASYSSDVKRAYEKGYAVAIGACVSPCSDCAGAACTARMYSPGVEISSSASGSRRAATVTFTTTLTTAGAISKFSSGCIDQCTSTSLGASINTMTILGGVSVGTVEVTTLASATHLPADPESEDSETAIWKIIVGAILAVVLATGCVTTAVLWWEAKPPVDAALAKEQERFNLRQGNDKAIEMEL